MTLAIVTPLYRGPSERPLEVARLHDYHADVVKRAGLTAAEQPAELYCNTDLIRARSRALCTVYRAGFDHLLFWDADVGGPPEQVGHCLRQMMGCGDIVHCEYPKRGGGWSAHGVSEYDATKTEFTLARYVTMGFTLISRECMRAVLESEAAARVAYEDHYDGQWHVDAAVFALIIAPSDTPDGKKGLLLEEGYSFCERAAWVGIKPMLYVGEGCRLAHG